MDLKNRIETNQKAIQAAKNIEPIEAVDLLFHEIVDSYTNLPRFIKRGWLEDEVLSKLRDPQCRFVLVVGSPGAGKSAFVSQLLKEHTDWLAYFLRRDQRTPFHSVSASAFLMHIGFQLAALYPQLFSREQIEVVVSQRIGKLKGELVAVEVERIISSPFHKTVVNIQQQVKCGKGKVTGLRVGEWTMNPWLVEEDDLLNMALLDPARALRSEDPEKKITIVIDALDELRYHPGRHTLLHWLINCPYLPSNIQFVLTSRPPEGALKTFVEKQQAYLRHIAIEESDHRVQKDLDSYIDKILENERVSSILRDAEHDIDRFRARAIAKAEGNIGYLDALGRGIDQALKLENGPTLVKRLLTLDQFPDHLEGLYAFFLHQIRDMVEGLKIKVEDNESGNLYFVSAWNEVYKPVLAILAVAREPLTALQVQVLSGSMGSSDDVLTAIGHLTQFLDRSENQYRLYHSTLPEFLTAAKTHDNAETQDLYIDQIQWHARVANYYWIHFQNDWHACDPYGLNNLAAHLFYSNARDRLEQLFTRDWLFSRYVKAQYSYAGFLSDVNLAWQSAVEHEDSPATLLLHLKAVHCVVHHDIATYSNKDLEILAWMGRQEEAIGYARLRSDVHARCEGLLAVHSVMAREGNPDSALLDDVHNTSVTITDNLQRIEVLGRLALAFASFDKGKAKTVYAEAASLIESSLMEGVQRPKALRQILAVAYDVAPEDTAALVEQILKATKTLHLWDKIEEMKSLASLLIEQGTRGKTEEIIKEFRHAVDAYVKGPGYGWQWKITAQTHYASLLVAAGRRLEAKKYIAQFDDAFLMSEVNLEIANSYLKERRIEDAKKHIYTEVSNSEADKYLRSVGQCYLGTALLDSSTTQAQQLLNQAIEDAKDIHGYETQYKAQVTIAKVFAQARLVDALARLVESVEDEKIRGPVMKEYAFCLAQSNHEEAGQVFQASRELEDEVRTRTHHQYLLKELFEGLVSVGELERSHRVIPKIQSIKQRLNAYRYLVEQYANAGHLQEAKGVLSEMPEYPPYESIRDTAKRELAIALAQKKHFHEAQKTADAIQHEFIKGKALVEIAIYQLKDRKNQKADALLMEIESMLSNIAYAPDKARLLQDCATSLIKADFYGYAIRLLDNVEVGSGPAEEALWKAVVEAFVELGASEQALTYVSRIGRPDDRGRVLIEILDKLEVANPLFDTVYAKIQGQITNISYGYDLASASIQFVTVLAKKKDSRLKSEFSKVRMYILSAELTHTGDRDILLQHLADAMSAAGYFAEAEDAADDIRDQGKKALPLQRIVEGLYEAGETDRADTLFGKAKEAVLTISRSKERADHLRYLAETCNRVNCEEFDNIIEQARKSALAMTENSDQSIALRKMAGAIAVTGNYNKAKRIAKTIEDASQKRSALRDIAHAYLRGSQFQQALETVDIRDLNELFRFALSSKVCFDGSNANLYVNMLCEAIDVMGWVYPQWEKMHATLCNDL